MTPSILRVISETLGEPLHRLTPETTLAHQLGCDSLDLLEVCMSLEAEFGIEIPDSSLERARTVGDLINLVEELT